MSDRTYRAWVEDEAARLGSDGCTGGFGAYRFCCLEHDVLYRGGKHQDGRPCSKAEADHRFRSCIQRESRVLGWWNPIAWWRWFVVKYFAKPKARAQGVRVADVAARRRAEIVTEVIRKGHR